jgi:hypothetical protein
MKIPFKFQLMAIIMLLSFSAYAQEQTSPSQTLVFFVSMLLSKSDEPGVVKLVHSIQKAPSKKAAEESFHGLVARDFPGYAVMDTISSAASGITAPACISRSFGVNI